MSHVLLDRLYVRLGDLEESNRRLTRVIERLAADERGELVIR